MISVFIGFVIIGFVMYVQCSLTELPSTVNEAFGWNIHARIKNRKIRIFRSIAYK